MPEKITIDRTIRDSARRSRWQARLKQREDIEDYTEDNLEALGMAISFLRIMEGASFIKYSQ